MKLHIYTTSKEARHDKLYALSKGYHYHLTLYGMLIRKDISIAKRYDVFSSAMYNKHDIKIITRYFSEVKPKLQVFYYKRESATVFVPVRFTRVMGESGYKIIGEEI